MKGELGYIYREPQIILQGAACCSRACRLATPVIDLGVSYALTPNLGIVHECKMSVVVIMIRMNVFIDKAAQLSTLNTRKLLIYISFCGII
jgi:hypothetical protein